LIDSAARSLLPTIFLVLAALVARIIYLRFLCPYDLIEDEAHYWLWAQYPAWSYYSKGPGVAWTIWLSTSLLGDHEWAVRLPAAIASFITALASAALARDLAVAALERTGDADRTMRAAPRTVALASAAAVLLAPALQMVGILMTIDGPYIACWAVAAWAFNRAVSHASRIAWPLLGAAIAIGFLYKYTMLLLIPGVLLFAVTQRRHLRLASNWKPLAILAAFIGALGLVPVLIWNAQHDWSTLRHLLGHLGLSGGDMPVARAANDPRSAWSPLWLPTFLLQQIGMIGPALMLALIASWRILRRRNSHNDTSADSRRTGQLLLICCAAPILLFYLLVSLIAEPEGNWPLAAHVTLLPLAAWWAMDMLALRRARRAASQPFPRGPRGLWHAAILYGLLALPLLHRADLAVWVLNTLNDQSWFRSTFSSIMNREPQDVVLGRLTGAKQMAAHAERVLSELPRDSEPFILTQHYGRASQLAFYLPRERTRAGTHDFNILCAMSQTGGRKSQFDMWPFTSLSRSDLPHHPALILSNDKPDVLTFWRSRFASIEPIPSKQLEGEHKKDRFAYIGLDYTPLPAPSSP
jgi:4-amino-4-deoxy-L-arabinose transferase-like glycosyltransferase